MSWAGVGQSGLFWTVNTDGSIARVDWEFPQGDVSGVIDNLLVIGLQGRNISSDIPVSGDILQFNGGVWAPTGASVLVSGVPHNLLSSTHPDTTAAAPEEGDLVAGYGSPAAWTRFPRGADGYILSMASGGNLSWSPPGLPDVEILTAGTGTILDENNRAFIVNKTVGSSTEVMLPPSPFLGQQIIVKDGKGDANTNQILIYASSTTIDGNTGVIMRQNYQSFSFLNNGTEWNII